MHASAVYALHNFVATSVHSYFYNDPNFDLIELVKFTNLFPRVTFTYIIIAVDGFMVH